MKYLGIDFGLRKLGLSLGDDVVNLAFPLGNIDGGDLAIQTLIDRAKQEDADAFVVGLPIPDAHQTTDQLEKTKQFARDLQAVSQRDVYVVDEQFSSAEARRLQYEYGSDMPEDALAATIILQAFLDGDRDLTIETATQREE